VPRGTAINRGREVFESGMVWAAAASGNARIAVSVVRFRQLNTLEIPMDRSRRENTRLCSLGCKTQRALRRATNSVSNTRRTSFASLGRNARRTRIRPRRGRYHTIVHGRSLCIALQIQDATISAVERSAVHCSTLKPRESNQCPTDGHRIICADPVAFLFLLLALAPSQEEYSFVQMRPFTIATSRGTSARSLGRASFP
jgi:hypothetical protein